MRKKVRNNKGITLLVLTITIIILLILAGVTISALTGENGILTQASLASLETKFSNYKEELELYKVNKTMENQNFESGSLAAGQTDLNYNTKKEEETGNIKTIITNLEDNNYFSYESGILLEKESNLIVFISPKKLSSITTFEIPEGIITLNESSFKFAVNAEIINLPESLNSIGNNVFRDCYKIKTIYMGQNVSNIAPRFKNLNYNGTVVVDNDYYVVKNNVLYKKDQTTGKCTTLVRVLYEIDGTMQILDEVKHIGERAFYGQRKMTEIIIPEGVETIGCSFTYCSVLKRIEIPSTVKSIDSGCFSDATNSLEEIIIHNTEDSIPEAPWGAVKGMKVVQWVGEQ